VVVVVVVVVVVEAVVEEVVVVVVVPVQVLVVHTASPSELQTQVLQSTVKEEPGVQGEPEPEPEPEPPATGQEEGQVPSEPEMCSPPAVTLVLHHGPDWSTVVHSVYTTPLYLKGNWQVAPVVVVQGVMVRVSEVQEEEAETSQSPQLLVMTLPSVLVAVAHQGTGLSV